MLRLLQRSFFPNLALTTFLCSLAITAAIAAPRITNQPAGRTVHEGNAIDLTVSATGRGPLGFQWQRNGAVLAGATTSRLTITSIRVTQAGNYTVTVSDDDGATESTAAVVAVTLPPDIAPVIVRQPGATMELNGRSDDSSWLRGSLASVEVEFGQASPFAFQWFREGTALPGQTAKDLDLGVIQEFGPGEYFVIVYNPAGRTRSASLRVTGVSIARPVIITQPTQLLDVVTGQRLLLSVSTNVSRADATFVWRRNGNVIADAAGPELFVAAAAESNAGEYTVTVANSAGSVTSKPSRVSVSPPANRPLLVEVSGDYFVDLRFSPGGVAISAREAVTNVQAFRNGTPIPADQIRVSGNSVFLPGPTAPVVSYTGTIATATGSAIFPAVTITYLDATTAPRIVFQSGGGSGFTPLRVSVRGEWPLRIEWFRDGELLPGLATYQDRLDTSTPGVYTARISNEHGSVTTAPMRVDLPTDFARLPRLAGSQDGRLVNLSSRGAVSVGAPLIAGFVVGGTGSKRVLVRAVGPTLTGFGLRQPLADPRIRLIDGNGRELAANDNWGDLDRAGVADAARRAGAFPLPEGSRDAALVATLPIGSYSAVVTGVGEGVALAEVYDLDEPDSPSRLTNLSIRARNGTGEAVVVPGAVASRAGLKHYLWRVIGPSLSQFGVTDPLGDPRFVVIDDAARSVASNDDWGTSPDSASIRSAASLVGAFALSGQSKDAAAIVPMVRGSWTAVVSDARVSEGSVLVEIYELP